MPKARCLNKGDEMLVRVVHVTDPHNFYVRCIDDDNWVLTFQELVGAHTPLNFPRACPPIFGQLVLLNHPKHGWARGAIIRVDDNGNCRVRTLDYGDALHVNCAELRRLDFGDATPPKAIHCSLYMCHPKNGKTWTSSSIKTFVDYLGENALDMTVMDKIPAVDQLIVELNSGWPETVSKLMVMAEAACFGNFPQQIMKFPQVSNSGFKYDSLKIGEQTNVQVLKIEGLKFYSVKSIRSDLYFSIYELLEEEFEKCDTLKNKEVVVGAPVVCKLIRRALDHYFRGEVVEYNADTKQIKVFLVDLGDYETVDFTNDNFRKCNSKLLEEPTFAIPCVINETQKHNKHRCRFLAPGLCLCIKTEKKEKNVHIVEIVNDSMPN